MSEPTTVRTSSMSGCPYLAVAVAAVFSLLGGCGTLAAAAFDAGNFLRSYAGFSGGDLARIARGEVAARTLDSDAREVAICAAVVMNIPASFYVQRFREIESFKRGGPVLQVGRFGPTRSTSELRNLTIDDPDIEDLEECQPGDCDVRLDRAAISLVRSRIGNGSAGAAARAADAMREILADYAARYRERGNVALVEYADREHSVRLSDELRTIVQHSPYLARELPGLHDDIMAFNGSLSSGAEDFLYWSKERVGPRSVITLTHAIIRTWNETGLIAIGTKQIYASHYFDASLGITLLLDETGADGRRTTLIYLNRSRLDTFGGLLGALKRSIARSRARSGAEEMLRALGRRLEREFHARPSP